MLVCKENKAMKATLFAAAFLTILSTASFAQNAVNSDTASITHAQAKELVRTAKTPEDYLTLRNYYARVAQVESLKAAEEKAEWNRRAANPLIYARKYPSPVDSAHYLYDSYSENAKTSAAEARRYEQLAMGAKNNN
jgi:hypothetical protein